MAGPNGSSNRMEFVHDRGLFDTGRESESLDSFEFSNSMDENKYRYENFLIIPKSIKTINEK